MRSYCPEIFRLPGFDVRAPQDPPNMNKIYIDMGFYILAHVWKTAFQIISPYCTYVSIVMKAAFADISVPLIPLDCM